MTAQDNNALSSLAVTINDVALPLDESGQAAFTLAKSGAYTIKAITIDVAGNLARGYAPFVATVKDEVFNASAIA